MSTTAQRAPETALRYDRPAGTWVEALPLGNGHIGAMCFGGVGHDRIGLNDETLWSGNPARTRTGSAPAGQTGAEAVDRVRTALREGRVLDAERLLHDFQGEHTQSFMPLGDLLLDLTVAGNSPTQETVTGYRRELDLDAATAESVYRTGGVEVRQQVFASHPADVLVVRLTADRPGALALTARMTSPLRYTTKAAGDDGLALLVRCPADVSPPHREQPDPIRYADGPDPGIDGAAALRVVTDGRVRAADGAVTVHDASAVTLVLSTHSGYQGWDAEPTRTAEDCWAIADARVAAAVVRDPAELAAEHRADHRALFRRCALSLTAPEATATLPTDERLLRAAAGAGDPGLAALLFHYGRYLLIACSRPGGLPATLQGIWNEQAQPEWSSNYTLNINAEMNYWPAETTALPECHEPLLDLVGRLAQAGRSTARELYGCGGWVAHHNTDAWCWTAPVGGDPRWANWAMGGVWLCRHLWEHYAFTGDADFLRRAWPLMRGAAEFCLDWLVEMPDGTLGTSPSTSPENAFLAADGSVASVAESTAMDIALISGLFADCGSAASVLGLDDPLLPRLAAAAGRLPAHRIGSRGQVLEWAEELPEVEPHHRHVSHLVGAYPGGALTPHTTPEHAAAVAQSLDLRTDQAAGWSLAWKVCLRARLGDAEAAHRLLAQFLVLTRATGTDYTGGGAGVYANLFCAHPPFQIDGNFGVTAGIAEMLLQSHTAEIDLLPALPAAWADGAVRGLRARGGIGVDISWAQGRLTSAVLTADRDCQVPVRSGDRVVVVGLRRGVATRVHDLGEPVDPPAV